MTDTQDGAALDYWKQYYTPDEIEEAESNTQTTMIVSGGLPVHVRLWVQPKPAPTVVIGSSILSYGLHLIRVQAPFYRAGFNVVQLTSRASARAVGRAAAAPCVIFCVAGVTRWLSRISSLATRCT